jgi:methyl-accepting chemotaxis protein/methyl-accepting chemotaxis protein-1 (serine sensor receptor)
MRHWRISRKLFTGFGSLVLTAIAMGSTGLWASSTLNARIDRLAAVSGRALQLAGDIRFLVADLKARERLVVIAAAKQDTAVMASETAAVDREHDRLVTAVAEISTTATIPRIREDAAAIAEAIAAWTGKWQKTRAFAAQFQALDAADSSEAGRTFGDRAERLASDIQSVEADQFAADRARASLVYGAMRAVLGVLLLVAFVIAGAVGYAVRGISTTLRRSAAELRHGSEEVLTAAAQVNEQALKLSDGVSHAASSLEETSASMEEIASMTRQNASNSTDAAGLMAEAEHAVAAANDTLTELVTSMGHIKESSRKVSNIIKTIDEIAFQTNILALNAAVEAARAGDAGMGFAVVADEVRNLAQRSAQAAKDTTALIEESIARSDRGAARVERVGASMQAITESVARVKTLIDHVSDASRQQAHGVDQVSQALSQMERMTQANAATAEASTAAGTALTKEAMRALETVEHLEALVGTGQSEPPPSIAPRSPGLGAAPNEGQRRPPAAAAA